MPIAPFTYLYVLMTDDVNYTYFVHRFIYKHNTFNIVFVYLFMAHSVVLRHLRGDCKISS